MLIRRKSYDDAPARKAAMPTFRVAHGPWQREGYVHPPPHDQPAALPAPARLTFRRAYVPSSGIDLAMQSGPGFSQGPGP